MKQEELDSWVFGKLYIHPHISVSIKEVGQMPFLSYFWRNIITLVLVVEIGAQTWCLRGVVEGH
jgi:hypothetical protein